MHSFCFGPGKLGKIEIPVNLTNYTRTDISISSSESSIFPSSSLFIVGMPCILFLNLTCEFNDVCRGSRSRAYAVTGDYLAEDLSCKYQPGTIGKIADK